MEKCNASSSPPPPEEAGNEKMDVNTMNTFSFFDGLSMEQVRAAVGMTDNTFNYTLAALRLSHIANGVSKLHGEVSRQMWKDYEGICPIIHITNAQNQKYWQDPELAEAFQARNKEAFIRRKRALKKALFRMVGEQTGRVFDPTCLTIVWARRFAAYKRPDLVTGNPTMFERMLQRTNYPVQFIWAGKPYPMDHGAIEIFNRLNDLTAKYPRSAVLTGYELGLSRYLKNGSDVWLNNPVVTREASGTSGMSAAMNGSISVSTNDGWICEFAKDGENCFVIPEAPAHLSPEARDRSDRDNFYNILDDKILPLYYDHNDKWMDIVFNAMTDIYPEFDSDRMADQYYTEMYNS
ncbi:MAG: alpha-glucan family phosphorylase [Akkermansia sp.]